jgi:hypothetical protein
MLQRIISRVRRGRDTDAAAAMRQGYPMIQGFENIQKMSKDSMDVAVKSLGTVTKSVQTIATEAADYSKKSFEHGTATLEKLMGVKSLEKAMEIQSDYAKSAYESFVAQATKMSGLYSDLAKEIAKPVQTAMANAQPAAK